MVDVEAVVRENLAGLAGVRAVFGSRIYAGVNLPAGYKPQDGVALLLAMRGGSQDFSSKLFSVSIQVRVYAESEAQARQAAKHLYDELNDSKARRVCYARMESGTMPVLLLEPETNWPYVLMFFRIFIQNA